MSAPSSGANPGGANEIADAAARAGIGCVHAFAWRDLEDAEAGGSELFIARVLEVWASCGLDITLRTSMVQGRATRTTRAGYQVVRRSGRLSVFPRAIAGEMVRRNGPRPDAVLEAWNGIPFASPLWFRGPRVTVLHHVHEDMWPMALPGPLAKVGWFVEGTLAPPWYRNTPIVTNSVSSRDEIVARLGLPPEHITIAPPGVDPRWRPLDGTRADAPTVVAVGRLVPHKHFDELIRIAAEVRRSVPDLRLVIVGEGYERPHLETVSATVGGQEWINLPGRVSDDELRDLYRQAWVVAATSTAEGFGMTLTEAAACGTPSVATNVAGHCDAVIDGRSGLLCDDPAAMTEALRAVLTDTSLRDRLQRGALERAQELTWERAAATVFAPLVEFRGR